MSILSSHAASWHSDKWYRRAWYIWPQVASLLVVGWVFAGVLLKPNPPWAVPQPPARPPQQERQPSRDTEICWLGSGYSRDATLNACGRLIDKGEVWAYYRRAQIYFWNGNYDRAIEDFSAFIHQNPYSDKGLNERGLSYAKKGEYDRAIADYTEAIRLNREPVGPYINRGSAYETKGELDKALADFREALSHGSTTASEDIKRLEGAIQSLRSKYGVDGLRGLSLGARVSVESTEYRDYQCTPSQQFEGVTWCNKQRLEKEARGLYRSSYTIAHSRDGTVYYLNRSFEPAFFNAGEVDNDIKRLSQKFDEQPKRVAMPHGAVDGLIATWGKVTLESLDPSAVNELREGRNVRKGILIDFIGNFTDSARRGLPIYRVTGGPGFVWAASFNSEGRGTLRNFAIDPSALLPGTAKESTAPVPT